MADIFQVISDATRRDILRTLLDAQELAAADADRSAHADPSDDVPAGPTAGASETKGGPASPGEMSVSGLVAKLDVSQPTVSKHLKVLREAELVTVREEGQHRFYTLSAEPLTMVEDFLFPFFNNDLDTEVTVEYVAANGEVIDPDAEVLPESARAVASNVGRAAATATQSVKELVARFKLRG